MAAERSKAPADWVTDKSVLLVISGGLIAILLTIIIGIFQTERDLPNWAENVFVSIATACALKLGDCLATLIALSAGRTTERLGDKLAQAGPATPPAPQGPSGDDAADGAEHVANAADRAANQVTGGGR